VDGLGKVRWFGKVAMDGAVQGKVFLSNRFGPATTILSIESSQGRHRYVGWAEITARCLISLGYRPRVSHLASSMWWTRCMQGGHSVCETCRAPKGLVHKHQARRREVRAEGGAGGGAGGETSSAELSKEKRYVWERSL
jgi:hypothetical protein